MTVSYEDVSFFQSRDIYKCNEGVDTLTNFPENIVAMIYREMAGVYSSMVICWKNLKLSYGSENLIYLFTSNLLLYCIQETNGEESAE